MQNTKRRYDRFFIMFRQELSGYSIDGREPNGYCKIEVRDGKGRISTYIQGLKPLNDGTMYRVYLISAQNNKSLGIPIGWLDINNRGRGECRWEFNPDNLEGTGLAIEDFNVGAIIIKGDKINDLIAPIVGYKDREVLWKKGFKDFSVHRNNVDEDKNETFKKIQNSTDTIKEEKIIKEQIKVQPNKERELDDTKNITRNKEITLNKEVTDENKSEIPIQSEIEQEKFDKIEIPKQMQDTIKESNTTDMPDVNVDKEKVNPHKIFNDMVSKFYAEMAELEKYKILSSEDKKLLDLELDTKEKTVDDIEYMFQNNENIIPFERANKDIKWIKVAPFELVTLDLPTWTYIKHQFINAAWKKYKYLILGRYSNSQNTNYSYILGIPDTYDEKYSPIAQSLGFKKFICAKGRIFQKGDMGYWLMEL